MPSWWHSVPTYGSSCYPLWFIAHFCNSPQVSCKVCGFSSRAFRKLDIPQLHCNIGYSSVTLDIPLLQCNSTVVQTKRRGEWHLNSFAHECAITLLRMMWSLSCKMQSCIYQWEWKVNKRHRQVTEQHREQPRGPKTSSAGYQWGGSLRKATERYSDSTTKSTSHKHAEMSNQWKIQWYFLKWFSVTTFKHAAASCRRRGTTYGPHEMIRVSGPKVPAPLH